MNLRARLVGLTATALIIALIIGLPIVLLQVGADLIPDTVPTLERLRTAITSPDDGTLALTVITLIAWVAWAVLAASLLLEIAAQARNIHPPRLPGLSLPQGAARELVAAAALLFIAVPTTAMPTAASASGHTSLTVPAATVDRQAPALQPATAPSPPSSPQASPPSSPHTADREASYTIAPGDTLSRIAREHLGDSDLWPHIVEANPHLAADPDLIHPGDVIELPVPPEPTTVPRQYTVRAGDTLSGIAHRFLGDGDRWPEVFAASTSTIQPGGVRITDPHQIDIGQVVTIPATTTRPNSPAAGSEAVEPPPSAPHTTPSEPGHDRAPAGAPGVPTDVPTTAPQTQQGGAASPTAPSATPSASSPSPTATQPSRGAATHTDAPGSSGPAVTPPVPAGARQDHTPSANTDTSAAQTPWLLAGLSGGGALLAGAMMLLLRQRRRAQLRTRRPGHTLTTPEPPLHPVEKTLTAIGTVTAPTIERLDAIARRLAAARAATGSAMPDLAAVELTAAEVILHLRTPTELPEPWNGTDDHLHWGINAHTPLDDIGPEIPDQPAPYPLLVTIGVGDADQMWLLNLEDLTVTITGDPTFGQDFARYLAADLACNPWASGVTVTCSGIATELTALNPDRIRAHDPTSSTSDPAGEHLAEAVATIDRAHDADLAVATARAHQHGADSWPAHVLLLDATAEHPDLDQLIDLIATHPGATASAVVLCEHAGGDTTANTSTGTSRDTTAWTVLEITPDGRLHMPQTGLDLIAVGLTPDEAHGCAALIAQAETATNTPVPVDTSAEDGWHSLVDEAGALRREHTQPRHPDHAGDDGHDSDTEDDDGQDADSATDAAGAVSLLEDDDQTYLQTAATTEQDLATLAPRVPAAARATVEDTDPSLDHDVAMWFHPDCALPRLHLLGPVRATTRGKPMIDRKPYMTALLTFIALTPHGATPEEVAQTFNITTGKAREYVRKVRNWLGENPRTHTRHLPYAKDAPGTAIRTTPVYQVIDLLIDIDIFRRLRARGQARGGPDGIADLTTALKLVQGRPFDYPIQNDNERNWTWLIDGDRLDQHIAVAIIDVAHIVTTHALAAGDLATARTAAETALTAAPDEDTPRLDLAAVAQAEGNHAEAQHIIRDDICNRTDDDGPPPELAPRTQQVLQHRKQRLHKAS